MARTSAITQQEQINWQDFCTKYDFIPGGENGKIATNYFVNIWDEDITPKNLEAALEQLRPSLKQWEPNQKEFMNLWSALSPAEQEAFRSWKGGEGLEDSHVFFNGAIILRYIKAHNWPVDPEHLQLTIGQNSVSGHLQWKYVSNRRQSIHTQNDDGKPFFSEGLTKQADGSWGKSPLDYGREMRAVEEAANPQTTPEQTKEDQSWLRVAQEACRFGSHSQQAQIQKVYDQSVAAGLPPRKICDNCASLRDTFKRNEEMSNRAGYYSR
jgi:hypothetical protein